MKLVKIGATLVLLSVAILVFLAACDKRKGGPCDHPGDLWAGHGVSYTCTAGPNGDTWQ